MIETIIYLYGAIFFLMGVIIGLIIGRYKK